MTFRILAVTELFILILFFILLLEFEIFNIIILTCILTIKRTVRTLSIMQNSM